MIRIVSPHVLTATMVLFVAALSLSAVPAMAQQYGAPSYNADNNAVANRLDRLERDMQTLSRQVYRGTTPTGAGQKPAAGQSFAGEGYAAEFELRLQSLEAGLRKLTGQVEQLQHDQQQHAARLDRAVRDIEYRLDHGVAAATDSAAVPPPLHGPQPPRIVRPNAIDNVTPTAPQAPYVPDTQAAESDSHPPSPRPDGGVRTLGLLDVPAGTPGALPLDGQAGALPAVMPPGDNASRPLGDAVIEPDAPPTATPAPATAVEVKLPDGDAQTQYDYAFGLLKRYQFDAAGKALTLFLERHPEDPLTANAQFWLGETHYVNGDYADAARAFATGYQKFPDAAKAPESLLKLGMSLGRLGQKKDACASLDRLTKEYPNAAGSVKQQASTERRDLGCDGT